MTTHEVPNQNDCHLPFSPIGERASDKHIASQCAGQVTMNCGRKMSDRAIPLQSLGQNNFALNPASECAEISFHTFSNGDVNYSNQSAANFSPPTFTDSQAMSLQNSLKLEPNYFLNSCPQNDPMKDCSSSQPVVSNGYYDRSNQHSNMKKSYPGNPDIHYQSAVMPPVSHGSPGMYFEGSNNYPCNTVAQPPFSCPHSRNAAFEPVSYQQYYSLQANCRPNLFQQAVRSPKESYMDANHQFL